MRAVGTSSTPRPAGIDVNLSASQSSWLALSEKQSLFDRYFMIAIAIALTGITGGIVIGYCVSWHLWQIAAVVGVSLLPLIGMLFFAVFKYISCTGDSANPKYN